MMLMKFDVRPDEFSAPSHANPPGQQYALQGRKHIAALRRARPGIVIEIRWCPAHKGIASNEKADEWAKIAAEEPDTRRVEWLSYSDRAEARAVPLQRSVANLRSSGGRSPRRSGRRHASGLQAGFQDEIPDAEKLEAGRHGGWEH